MPRVTIGAHVYQQKFWRSAPLRNPIKFLNRNIIFASLLYLISIFLLAVAIHFITANNTLGSDFATFWIGSKSAVYEGKSPYSQEVIRFSQLFIYHRLAFPTEDQVAFSYPLQAVLVIAPFSWMDIAWAQAFWMSFTIITLLTALYIFVSLGKRVYSLFIFFILSGHFWNYIRQFFHIIYFLYYFISLPDLLKKIAQSIDAGNLCTAIKHYHY